MPPKGFRVVTVSDEIYEALELRKKLLNADSIPAVLKQLLGLQ